MPNPRIESVDEGVGLYRQYDCDFILAVGGGSTLDACKAIAAGVMYDGPVTDLLSMSRVCLIFPQRLRWRLS